MPEPSQHSDTPPILFTRAFDRRVWITAVVVGTSLLVGALLTLHAAWPDRIRRGYKPEQPLMFSHVLHAGSMEIRCLYCHVEADKGDHALVPPVSVCMNCHEDFRGDPEKPHQVERVAEIVRYWEAKEPVIWEKVYDLEDFAYFSHSRHVTSGLACINCHGTIETMPVVQRVTSL
ncbi:cytochrome c3 family protein, partial [bacterium]|nr:cytochrome c3 family protein [bacterium]